RLIHLGAPHPPDRPGQRLPPSRGWRPPPCGRHFVLPPPLIFAIGFVWGWWVATEHRRPGPAVFEALTLIAWVVCLTCWAAAVIISTRYAKRRTGGPDQLEGLPPPLATVPCPGCAAQLRLDLGRLGNPVR